MDDLPAAIRLSPQSLLPAVVGFHEPLAPRSWQAFLKSFYAALVRPATCGMVDVAANEARDRVLHDTPDSVATWDWTSPMVLLRSSGTLFRPEGSPDPLESLIGRLK